VTSSTFWFITLPLLAIILFASPIADAGYKPIVSLSCPDGELVIDANPKGITSLGLQTASQLNMRYRYRGIELIYFDYGSDKILLDYLQRDKSRVRDLGLHPKVGHWYNGTYPEEGHTLYLPPSQFSTEQVDRLAACIRANRFKIKDAFINTLVYGRALLMLMSTSTRIRHDGIANLVHAERLPFIAAYRWDNYGHVLMVIEQNGQVVLYNTYPEDKKHLNEKVIWGQMLPAKKGRRKPRLILKQVTLHEFGKASIYDSERAKKHNRLELDKEYDIVAQ